MSRLGWCSLVSLLAGSLALGCGGAERASEPEPSSSPGGEVAGESDGFDMEGFEDEGAPEVHHGSASARELLGVHPPPTPFHEMSHQEQVDWMVGAVLPIAAEDFARFDPRRHAEATCALCHGDDAEARGYAMPSPHLLRLPTPGTADWERMTRSDAYPFMRDVVLPTMATLVGREPMSEEHPDGFSCFDCHTRRGE